MQYKQIVLWTKLLFADIPSIRLNKDSNALETFFHFFSFSLVQQMCFISRPILDMSKQWNFVVSANYFIVDIAHVCNDNDICIEDKGKSGSAQHIWLLLTTKTSRCEIVVQALKTETIMDEDLTVSKPETAYNHFRWLEIGLVETCSFLMPQYSPFVEYSNFQIKLERNINSILIYSQFTFFSKHFLHAENFHRSSLTH